MTFSNCKRKKLKLGQVGVGSNIAQNKSSSLQGVISGHYLLQIHMTSLPKVKLGQVGVVSNIVQNHLS